MRFASFVAFSGFLFLFGSVSVSGQTEATNQPTEGTPAPAPAPASAPVSSPTPLPVPAPSSAPDLSSRPLFVPSASHHPAHGHSPSQRLELLISSLERQLQGAVEPRKSFLDRQLQEMRTKLESCKSDASLCPVNQGKKKGKKGSKTKIAAKEKKNKNKKPKKEEETGSERKREGLAMSLVDADRAGVATEGEVDEAAELDGSGGAEGLDETAAELNAASALSSVDAEMENENENEYEEEVELDDAFSSQHPVASARQAFMQRRRFLKFPQFLRQPTVRVRVQIGN